jgi:conjugative transfer signal peptidase TraF
MTYRVALLSALTIALIVDGLASLPLPKLLLWNASASAPVGLYLLRPAVPLRVGELVVVSAPPRLAEFSTSRGYLPAGVPLLKHVAALPAQVVCRNRAAITINGTTVAIARERDSHGRVLPSWQGCRALRAGEVFLLNAGVPDSFDGRYFGPLTADSITARAVPVWTEAVL